MKRNHAYTASPDPGVLSLKLETPLGTWPIRIRDGRVGRGTHPHMNRLLGLTLEALRLRAAECGWKLKGMMTPPRRRRAPGAP